MELLQFLISFLLKELGGEKLAPVFNSLKDNSFDLSKLLNPETLSTFVPIIKDFFKQQNKTPTDFTVGEDYKLSPIARIADKDIVYTLNRYFN
ncbi:MAG: hypothetical protein IJX16_01590 [Clostridia bacterium]|nr:hypothetical protein [Clostridia bacterium]